MREGCGPQFWLRRSWLSVCPRALRLASRGAATRPGLRLRPTILSLNIGRRRSRSTDRRRSRSTDRLRSRSIDRRRNRKPGLRGIRHSVSRTVIPQMVLGRFIRVVLTGARFRKHKAGLRGTRYSVGRMDILQMFQVPAIPVLLLGVRLIAVRRAPLMQAPAQRLRATLETG